MTQVAIVYATTDGHTRRICERLQRVIETGGDRVTLLPIAQAGAADLAVFDKIVVGASIRYGKHSPLVAEFVDANRAVLDARPNAFFTVNIVARKPNRNRPETNPYLKKFLRQVHWQPKALEVFAGKLDYPRYGTLDRMMIRFIMWMTRGPTDPRSVVEFTDWNRVEAFGRLVTRM